ncbi:MAG: exodeoxyribonuclease VII large subunit [Marinifilaceae bacterium]|jgi:exodeoxyribonuclease VII large subunit|nr:exodeoxyribonuclease VII large subunit [Marinifilaceae bacterium]
MDTISLYELNSRIKSVIKSNFLNEVWLVAEISQMRQVSAGHCYMELVEKDVETDKIIAKCQANIWAYSFRMLKPYFETTTGERFRSGLKVLFKVSVEFQELYGYSLTVKDIDPSYTLGDLERKKRDTIKQLQDDGVFEMNKSITLDRIPKNIAIISSKTAAGFEDFINQLHSNEFNYKFHTKLFHATVQGEKAEESIINALEYIYEYEDVFDIVVILRGGGSQLDLSCFDSYLIASHICQYPIPVITAIGHQRDISICDMVAWKSLKTPTAAANFFIDYFAEEEKHINDLRNQFVDKIAFLLDENRSCLNSMFSSFYPIVKERLTKEKSKTVRLSSAVISEVKFMLSRQTNAIEYKAQSIESSVKQKLKNSEESLNKVYYNLQQTSSSYLIKKNYDLGLIDQFITYNKPENILKKGYAIIKKDNKIVKSNQKLKPDDNLEILFKDGKTDVIVR